MAGSLATAALASRARAAQDLPLGPLPGTRYPDPRIESLDPRFRKIGNAGIERVATGFRWCEGPVYVRDGAYLLWSDIPNNRIMRWSEDDGHVSVFRYPSNNSNGNTRDREGRLVTCEHDTRRVTRTEHDGAITVLIDTFEGKPLNAPNDAVVSADGAIWFTDPLFGNLGNYEGHPIKPELPTQVYRLDPKTLRPTVVATGMGGPDGLAFSADESKLYIVDTGVQSSIGRDSNVRVYDVAGDKLTNGRVFVPTLGTAGRSDGVRTDMDGNVWITMGSGDANESGVRCYAPNGDLIGKIHIPETCANLCFGGKKKNRLFICGSTSIYSLFVEHVGAQVP
ncbi:MAG: gluconolactonase [Acidobacteria bacterium]|nr:MAG: gluconolactonase [Acidobacteriota bacterium]